MRLHKPALLLLLAVILIALLPAFASTIRVKTDGDDGNDGSTWDLAKQTVSAAITAASSGDEIWVKAGTYNELITLKDGIGLCGGFTGYETEREERNWATAMSPTKLLVN